MLTKLTIRNFKRFEEVEIELGNPVAFIGPNNSGKTSAMQALALWDIGLKRWNEKRSGKSAPEKRPGVTVNRRDLIAIPVPSARLLWQGLHVRDVSISDGKQQTQNVRIDVIVEGVSNGCGWMCGLEFDYANEESFYCRPLRQGDDKAPARMPIPDEAADVQVAFLPPPCPDWRLRKLVWTRAPWMCASAKVAQPRSCVIYASAFTMTAPMTGGSWRSISEDCSE